MLCTKAKKKDKKKCFKTLSFKGIIVTPFRLLQWDMALPNSGAIESLAPFHPIDLGLLTCTAC